MLTKALPPRPSLEQYKKQAKDLVRDWKAREPAALGRVSEYHPRLAFADRERARFGLADAQWVIAREHGFSSWTTFTHHIEMLAATAAPDSIWRQAEAAIISRDADTLQRLLREHEPLFRNDQAPPYVPHGPRPDYASLNARTVIASEHNFDSWESFARFFAALQDPDSPSRRFEEAVDALVGGDLRKLQQMLTANPALVRARSGRKHRSTLLHYVGANGVEGFRQRTPPNAVAVASTLLDAGAKVDAAADMYGGNARTLGLVATSSHPKLAGVQDDLMELLITRGASFDADPTIINGCLANGRDKAAAFLAMRGAPLDLEGAAGLGRLDIVRTFFTGDGQLAPTATSGQLLDGFSWACEYGHAEVAEFLLDRGVDVNAPLKPHQQSGLHWAASGGYGTLVKLLLRHGARVDVVDGTWGTTPLMWALHRWSEEAPPDRYHDVVRLLVESGSEVNPEWLSKPQIRADPAMVDALTLTPRH